MKNQKLYKVYDENDNFIKSATLNELLQENYFVAKKVSAVLKQKLDEKDNYRLIYELVNKNGDCCDISPLFYFKVDLNDITTAYHKEKIAHKLRCSLQFKQLVEFNQAARDLQKSLEEVLSEAFLSNSLKN